MSDVSPDLRVEIDEAVNAVLTEEDYAAREAAAIALRKGPTFARLDDQQKAAVANDLGIKLSLRASADESAAKATEHMIEALASELPANPRQIKRIINIVSFMQEVARLEGMADPGSTEWQVLARWIVLMTEWPKTWFTLSQDPNLADWLSKPRAKTRLLSKDAKALGEAIKRNPQVMRLLAFEDRKRGWAARDIDRHQIEWLSALMPPASGRPLKIDRLKEVL